MWYTVVENCKGTIYNLIYGTCFTKKVMLGTRKVENNNFHSPNLKSFCEIPDHYGKTHVSSKNGLVIM
jgi:hypothetical protein